MSSFADLKRSRTADLEKLTKHVEKLNSKEYKNDERFWYPQLDKQGNGSALIRFLPAPEGEDEPFIRMWVHGFKGKTGLWYMENSRTSIGEDDPVAEFNSALWKTSDDDESPARKQVRAQKRKLTFIANILVVKDPANPENEGKVFLFKFGKIIFDMLNDLIAPPEDGLGTKVGINPFNMWEGANFRMIVYKGQGGWTKYDRSSFDSPGPIPGSDETLEAIWKSEYKLRPFLAPENYKSYEELQKQLHKVLGFDSKGNTAAGLQSAAAPETKAAAPRPTPAVSMGVNEVSSGVGRVSAVPDPDEDEMKKIFASISDEE